MIARRRLTQDAAADKLGVGQPKAPPLANDKFSPTRRTTSRSPSIRRPAPDRSRRPDR
ncbi:MAG: hypothetical protein WAU78_15495 [Roseiarcus sp.]